MIKKRCVLYFCGFDPSGPGHYHKLYRDNAAQQSALTQAHITVGKRQNLSKDIALWSIEYSLDSQTVQTDYHFMRWDDVVRQHWKPSGIQVAWQTLSANFEFIRTGALWTMFRLAWPPSIAVFSPALLLVFLLLVAPVVTLAIGKLFSWPIAITFLTTSTLAAWLAEKKFNMQWLIRSFAFTAKQARGQVPQFDEKIKRWADFTVKQLQANYDEVLLVGHSSGSMLAISTLAHSLRSMPTRNTQQDVPAPMPQISLLSLGHWTPMLSSLPGANGFRVDLRTLASAADVQWIDFGAPADGCCFALCDPLAAAHIPDPVNRPKLLSPRFAELFSKERYKQLKKNRFDLHFQYIKSGELTSDYDYFAISAGEQNLAQRYAHLPSVTDFKQFRLFG